ncbi:putative protease [Prevotella aff. ruminicola Tc2-24]|uniref:Putative protease n=1 Tax=Prevotella aff. ruminicola Tc2-24 TaxID=81582 RepID=A0A1I0PW22_9BACT|nr:U32 family peptidase [Prevotella aff. ruminicola Tc2-24]SEW18659.1 putative protease [Prevotella aff. ruminicola Tc2-24]
MRKLELLAPAKNLACGIAAVDHGADAVYIGAPRFGARAAVGNSVEDIRKLCEYAHPFGVRVYVTVNTILYDEELEATQKLLHELASAGVDAILVQDMGVLQMLKEESLTSLSVHASTQTDNRTAGKVQWLGSLGFSRTVLARELSIEEIAEIHRAVPDMELEVFVHGALCVCYSGICYASQHCFSRSANRGECAQFCRMRFSLIDADEKEIEHERYLLSLKDMNQSDNLERLIAAGATSFKIEGRLKDISYVKNVTAAYSERLNEIIRRYPDKYCRASQGHCNYTFEPNLNKTFNRGYTTYFANGRQPAIASFDTPKAIGEYVGTVKEIRGDSFNVAGVVSFSNGDGLCYLRSAKSSASSPQTEVQFEGFRANRVVSNRIYPYKMPQGLRPGMRLYRNSDQEFERLLSKPSAYRKIPITLSLSVADDGFEFSALLHGSRVSLHFPAEHQQAQKSPRENLVRQLTKLGDTIYECKDIEIPSDFNYFIPNSLLSEMRRQLVELLSKDGDSDCDKQTRLSVAHDEKDHAGYPYPYLYNISNRLARDFYGFADLTAFELKGGNGPIMQCRHCLRYSLGFCVKHGGKRPVWREPLSLMLGDGRRFRLEFDCQHCQMNIYADHC